MCERDHNGRGIPREADETEHNTNCEMKLQTVTFPGGQTIDQESAYIRIRSGSCRHLGNGKFTILKAQTVKNGAGQVMVEPATEEIELMAAIQKSYSNQK